MSNKMNSNTKYLLIEHVEDSISPLMIGTADEIVSMLTKQSLSQEECDSTEEDIREYYNHELKVVELAVIEGKNNKEYTIWEDNRGFDEFNAHKNSKWICIEYLVYKMDDLATMQKYLTQ